jgi:hypothetical protein
MLSMSWILHQTTPALCIEMEQLRRLFLPPRTRRRRDPEQLRSRGWRTSSSVYIGRENREAERWWWWHTLVSFLPSFRFVFFVASFVVKKVSTHKRVKMGFDLWTKFFFSDLRRIKKTTYFISSCQTRRINQSINQSINQLIVVLVNGNSRD